jgi:hypothetical protein
MASVEMITMAEYARRRGVSRATVHKAVRRCSIPMTDGKLDPLVADVLWTARTDPLQQRRSLGQNLRHSAPPTDGGGPVVENDFRRRREAAEAKLAEITLAERERTLCNAAEAQRVFNRFLSALKAQMDAVPDRISAEFGTDDAMRRKLRHRLVEELSQIRTELVLAGRQGDQ